MPSIPESGHWLGAQPEEHEVLVSQCAQYSELLESFAEHHKLAHAPFQDLLSWVLPLSTRLVDRHQNGTTQLIGVNGSQGAGKSTACDLLRLWLEKCHGLRVCALSIDDLYLSHADRSDMAQDIHPLLKTRGVPGTHDIHQGLDVIEALKKCGESDDVLIPRFNKAQDDIAPRTEWTHWGGPCDVILFEGWCVGAVAQEKADLLEPINTLEAQEDPDCRWRAYVNQQLNGLYKDLFESLDILIQIKAPSFECVFNWRCEQEDKLKAALLASGKDLSETRIMSHTEIERFIAHYERITRYNLSQIPEFADVVVTLGEKRDVQEVVSLLQS